MCLPHHDTPPTLPRCPHFPIRPLADTTAAPAVAAAAAAAAAAGVSTCPLAGASAPKQRDPCCQPPLPPPPYPPNPTARPPPVPWPGGATVGAKVDWQVASEAAPRRGLARPPPPPPPLPPPRGSGGWAAFHDGSAALPPPPPPPVSPRPLQLPRVTAAVPPLATAEGPLPHAAPAPPPSPPLMCHGARTERPAGGCKPLARQLGSCGGRRGHTPNQPKVHQPSSTGRRLGQVDPDPLGLAIETWCIGAVDCHGSSRGHLCFV